MKSNKQLSKENGLLIMTISRFGGYGKININGWSGNAMWEFDNAGWEHVMVVPDNPTRFSTQKDLDEIREFFWEAEETVVQFLPRMPRMPGHANVPDNAIHLWRPNANFFAMKERRTEHEG